MRPTLTEQVRNAAFAYILPLKTGGMTRRYAVYLQPENGGEIEVLWPSNTDGWKSEAKASGLYGLTYSRNGKLPAFHFCYRGHGYSASDAIRRDLQAINPSLEVRSINGHMPSASL